MGGLRLVHHLLLCVAERSSLHDNSQNIKDREGGLENKRFSQLLSGRSRLFSLLKGKPDEEIVDSLLKDTEARGSFHARSSVISSVSSHLTVPLRSTFAPNPISKNSLSSDQTWPPDTALFADRPWVIYHTFFITEHHPGDNEPFCAVWARFESVWQTAKKAFATGVSL